MTQALGQVSSVHIHGWADITAGAVRAIARSGGIIIWRSASGYPVVNSVSLSPAGLSARKAQYRIAEDRKQKLYYARLFVSAKIRNMRGLLRRRRAQTAGEAISRLARLAKKAGRARNIKRLLGLEGQASAIYFRAWPDLLGDSGAFGRRTRRPPENDMNAALSYLYTVLLGEVVCALTVAGLDPRQGFLHEFRAGRPALALDVIEPYRSIIVDACVSAAVNLGRVDLSADNLDEDRAFPKRTLLVEYERRLATKAKLPRSGEARSWRTIIELDALRLATSLRGNGDYQPVVWA